MAKHSYSKNKQRGNNIVNITIGIFISVISGTILYFLLPQDTAIIKQQANDIFEIRKQIESRKYYDFSMISPDNVSAYYYQGITFYDSGKYKEAIEKFKKAINAQIILGSLDTLDSARYYYNLGNAYFYAMDYKNAIIQYSNALGILELIKTNEEKVTIQSKDSFISIVSKEDLNGTITDNEISYVHYLRCISYLKQKDYERAFEEFEKIGIDVLLGTNEIVSISEQMNLQGDLFYSYAYQCKGEEKNYYLNKAMLAYNRAFNYCFIRSEGYEKLTEKEAKERRKKQVPVVDYYLFSPKMRLILRYSNMSEYAFDGYPIEIIEKKKNIAIALSNRSKMHLELNQIDKAIEDSKAALIIYQDLSLDERKNICDTYYNLMYAYLLKKDVETSRKYAQLAVEKQREWFGDKSIQTAIAYEIMSMIYLIGEDTDYDLAIKYLTEAMRIFESYGMKEDIKKEGKLIEIIQRAIEEEGTFEMEYN